MKTGRIVVFEDRPYWLPELQRRFDGTAIAVRGCSKAVDMIAAEERGTVIVLVLERRETLCLEILGRLVLRTEKPRVVCLSSEANADLEWPARELGASAFLPAHSTSDDVVRLCQRLLNK